MNNHFLTRLGSFFRDNKTQMAEMSEADIQAAIREARAHAGGKQKADNRMTMSEAFGSGGEWRLFLEREFAEPPATIHVLPKAGSYSHPKYGKFTLSPEDIASFVKNHNDRVYQEHVPIDAEHETKQSGALGYFGEMRLVDAGKGGAEADVEWTDRGRTLLASDRFKYFSPEWWDSWSDPATGQSFNNVLIGGAVTTRPFFKDKALRPLVARECEDGSYGSKVATGEEAADGSMTIGDSIFQFSEKIEDEPAVVPPVNATDPLVLLNKFADYMQAEDAEASVLAEEVQRAFNLDTGDVHVNALMQRLQDAKKKKKQPEPTPESGGKKAVEVDDATKQFVEEQTKKLTEELDAERGLRKASEERMIKLEGDAQARRFSDIISGKDAESDGSPAFPGERATHHTMLQVLAKEYGEDSDQFKAYVGQQRAVAKQMREAGMFKESGVGAGPDGARGMGGNVFEKQFNEKVEEWVTANPDKPKEQGIAVVARGNSRLYTEMVKEQSRKAKTASSSYGFEDEEDE